MGKDVWGLQERKKIQRTLAVLRERVEEDRPEVGHEASELPPVDVNLGTERRRVRPSRIQPFDVDADGDVKPTGKIERDVLQKEPDARGLEACRGRVARLPARGVEAREMPTFTFGEESTFVRDASDFVGEA